MSAQPEDDLSPKIIVMPDGSYHVFGNIPLVHKTQVVSENGEPLTWVKDVDYHVRNKEGKDYYNLCRCGISAEMPYCDGRHRDIGFDGAETADTDTFEARGPEILQGTRIFVKRDSSLCMQSGFCGFSDAVLEEVVTASHDAKMRALLMSMVERCPSGALTYSIEKEGADIEPDLPVQIAVTTEITSEGPIKGPLWVTGYVPVERSDGQPFETRNRVTLCNCGHSCSKPLCDGTHRTEQEEVLLKSRGG
jgi:CDGSH-type Zn-finger protein